MQKGTELQCRFRLRLYDELAFHSAVADPATIAAVEGVSARRAGHKFHYGRDSLFELEAIVIRTEDEAGIALVVRSIRAEIDLNRGPVETVILNCTFVPRCGWVMDCIRTSLRRSRDLYFLVRLKVNQPGEASGNRQYTQRATAIGILTQCFSSTKQKPRNLRLSSSSSTCILSVYWASIELLPSLCLSSPSFSLSSTR
jgi:hypothetical protein